MIRISQRIHQILLLRMHQITAITAASRQQSRMLRTVIRRTMLSRAARDSHPVRRDSRSGFRPVLIRKIKQLLFQMMNFMHGSFS